MSLLWDHPTHYPDQWICDVDGIGRYLIRRRERGSREFVLLLNGMTTKNYGTVNELKESVERVICSSNIPTMLATYMAAVEFGFKCCEKGMNLEATLEKAKEMSNEVPVRGP